MGNKHLLSRRSTLKGIGTVGAMSLFGSNAIIKNKSKGWQAKMNRNNDIRQQIFKTVWDTPFIDTHEHLIEEKGRFIGATHPRVPCDDWSFLMNHYLNSDLITAGMPKKDYQAFFSPAVDPIEKWQLIKPYWSFVKNTGYGQAVRIAIQELYGVDELSCKTISQVQMGYEKVRQPGFYRHILCERANIASCQVNSLEGPPFMESEMPTLLMQDLSIVGMFAGPEFEKFSKPTGITVTSLTDWYQVIDWWFDNYGQYAVAVKSQNAYSRDIDYAQVPLESAQPLFAKKLAKQSLTNDEQKALEDHLFWYATHKATEHNLPVKLHTGYYAGENRMPMSRLMNNPASATALCRQAPDTCFVFMHICYPYYEEMIAIAKAYSNAYVDMCWSWIINPLAAKDFLKKYLVTAPANKILTFGGDYVPVEPVLGHATIARQGIALALSELVEEGWLTLAGALALVNPIMHENARCLFNLIQKEKILRQVKWF